MHPPPSVAVGLADIGEGVLSDALHLLISLLRQVRHRTLATLPLTEDWKLECIFFAKEPQSGGARSAVYVGRCRFACRAQWVPSIAVSSSSLFASSYI